MSHARLRFLVHYLRSEWTTAVRVRALTITKREFPSEERVTHTRYGDVAVTREDCVAMVAIQLAHIRNPPFRLMTWPVINSALSDVRKPNAHATSSARTMRLSGVRSITIGDATQAYLQYKQHKCESSTTETREVIGERVSLHIHLK